MPVVINGSTGISGVDGSAGTPAVQGSDANTGVFFPAADTIAFAEGGGEVMRIDSSGNVGIGTTAPSGKFEVLHGVDGDDLITATTATGSGQIRLRPDGTNGNTIRYGGSGAANGVLRFLGPANVERARFDASGNFLFNSGYGSVATAYGCRAWVNFNGTGTVAIRASGNVSAITDNGTGDYTVNFTVAMPDANYAIAGTSGQSAAVSNMNCVGRNLDNSLQTTAAVRLYNLVTNTSGAIDNPNIFVSIFR